MRHTPVVSRAASPSAVKNGTRVTVRWPNSPRSNLADAESGFLSLASDYGWFNPHLTLKADLQSDDERLAGDRPRLDEVAAEHADLRALVRRRAPEAL